jgi:cyanophycinase
MMAKARFTARKDTNAVMNFSVLLLAARRSAASLSILMVASTLWGGDALGTAGRLPDEPLPGKLVICGGGYFPEAVYEKFVELAGGPHARLVIILTASEYAQSAFMEEYMQSLFRRFGVLNVQFLHTRSRETANDPTFVEPLSKATGVWIGGGVQQRLTDAYLGTAVEKALHGVLARDGVVGGTSSGAAVMSRLMILQGKTVAETSQGFGFLTGAVVDQHFIKRNRQQRLMGVLENNPGLFGLGIDEATAVVVEGRRMTVMGASQACICFAGCSERPPKVQMLKNGEQADLVALSRAAIARTRPLSPAIDEQPSQVEGGTLVIVGGGTTPPEAVERFIASAGGEDAPLVVVTTAQGDAAPPEQVALGWLRDAGAKNVKQIHARTRKEADDPKVLALLEAAKGVWFSGGRQWRLVDAFAYTKAYDLLKGVIEDGGVVGGSSAGAIIQGGYLVRGNPMGGDDLICEGYEEGFCFLPGVAIEQQFSQRNRFADMLTLKKKYPRLLGLGIDEATAVIVQGHELQVVGKHRVAVYDRAVDNSQSEQLYQTLAPGDRYDLVARQRLDPVLADAKLPRRDEDKTPGAVGQ